MCHFDRESERQDTVADAIGDDQVALAVEDETEGLAARVDGKEQLMHAVIGEGILGGGVVDDRATEDASLAAGVEGAGPVEEAVGGPVVGDDLVADGVVRLHEDRPLGPFPDRPVRQVVEAAADAPGRAEAAKEAATVTAVMRKDMSVRFILPLRAEGGSRAQRLPGRLGQSTVRRHDQRSAGRRLRTTGRVPP